MHTSRKAKPTEADIRAAARLKSLWRGLPRDRRPTQDQLAERYGEGGSQSLISQYMNGLIPLNIRALLFFARELACQPEDIYPDLPGLEFASGNRSQSADIHKGASTTEASTPADHVWATYSDEQKQRILELVELAGLIKSAPRSERVTAKDFQQSEAAANLRRQRKAQRARHKRNNRGG